MSNVQLDIHQTINNPTDLSSGYADKREKFGIQLEHKYK